MKITYSTIFDANVLLRLKAQVAKLEEVWIQTEVGQLEYFLEAER